MTLDAVIPLWNILEQMAGFQEPSTNFHEVLLNPLRDPRKGDQFLECDSMRVGNELGGSNKFNFIFKQLVYILLLLLLAVLYSNALDTFIKGTIWSSLVNTR